MRRSLADDISLQIALDLSPGLSDAAGGRGLEACVEISTVIDAASGWSNTNPWIVRWRLRMVCHS